MRFSTIIKQHGRWAFGAAVAAVLALGPAVAQDERETPADEPYMMDIPGAANSIQQANLDYGAGVRNVKQAEKLRKKAEKESGEERERMLTKAEESMERAVESFQSAVQGNPRMEKAYLGLGDALRERGRFDEAIVVYSQALQLEPKDWSAYHGRAQALVKAERIPDAVAHYQPLQQGDPKLASQLVASIRSWLEARKVDPKDLPPGALEEVEAWVSARETS